MNEVAARPTAVLERLATMVLDHVPTRVLSLASSSKSLKRLKPSRTPHPNGIYASWSFASAKTAAASRGTSFEPPPGALAASQRVSRRLVVRPFAERAIAEAFDHYLAIRPELGRRFLAAVDRAIVSVQDVREAWPLVTRTTRRYPLHLEGAFPYVLYFSVSEAKVIIVTVIHGKRHPVRWSRAR